VVNSFAYGFGIVFQLAPPAAPGGEWSFTTIYSFPGGNDGGDPSSITADSAGNLYGTDLGNTTFELTPPATPGGAWTETTLYTFTGGSAGDGPTGLVLGPHGSLYGVTWFGGTANCQYGNATGCGTVFELSPPGEPGGAWTESILYAFSGGSDGGAPNPGLVLGPDGTIYGSSRIGAQSDGPAFPGNVFQLSQAGSGWTETTLYQFGTGSYAPDPAAVTLDPGGSLLASIGTNNGGVVKLTPPSAPGGAWTEKPVYDFAPYSDGSEPVTSVTFDSTGAIYGATYSGGSAPCACGAVFKVTPPQSAGQPWNETLLYSFIGGSDGQEPAAGVVMDSGGTLYGTTYYRGASPNPSGTAFRLAAPTSQGGAWTKTVLHNFGNGHDGAGPNSDLIFGDHGELYGTTYAGGTYQHGAVFQLSPPEAPGAAWNERVIYSLLARQDSIDPVALAFRNGVLYGVAAGHNTQYGSVFRLTPPAIEGAEWNFTVLYAFTGQEYGAYPTPTLLFDDSGSIYGTTADGGGRVLPDKI